MTDRTPAFAVGDIVYGNTDYGRRIWRDRVVHVGKRHMKLEKSDSLWDVFTGRRAGKADRWTGSASVQKENPDQKRHDPAGTGSASGRPVPPYTGPSFDVEARLARLEERVRAFEESKTRVLTPMDLIEQYRQQTHAQLSAAVDALEREREAHASTQRKLTESRIEVERLHRAWLTTDEKPSESK